MKVLVTGDRLIAIAYNIVFGAWEEADKVNGVVVHKWKVEDENGNILGYWLDENQKSIDGSEEPTLKVYEVDEVPDDWNTGKYLFVDGEFVENPNYTEPPKPIEARVTDNENDIGTLYAFTEELLYKQCLLELGVTDDEL